MAVSTPATVGFALTAVAVGVGEAGASVEHRANNGEWIADGVTTAGGSATFDALAGTYTVRTHRLDSSQPHSDVVVSGATTTVDLT